MIEPKIVELTEKRSQRDAKKADLAGLKKVQTPDQPAIDALEAEIRTLENEIIPLSSAEKAWNLMKTGVTDLTTAFDAFEKALTTATGEKPAPIETLTTVDLLKSTAEAGLLQLSIPSQGAEINVSKSVWSHARISYMGGSVCVFFWLDHDGILKGAGSIETIESDTFKVNNGPAGTGG